MGVIELPNNREAERALIGAVLLDPAIARETDAVPEDFHNLFCRDTWTAIRRLQAESKDVNIITLANCGLNVDELMGVTNDCVSAYGWESYADIIRDCKHRRDIIQIAGDMAKAAYDLKEPIEPKIPAYMAGLLKTANIKAGVQPISVGLAKAVDHIQERAADPRDVWGLPTGLPDVDHLLGGLQKGEVFILTGQPGLGKSFFAMQVAKHIAVSKHPVACYHLEMGDIQAMIRELSRESGIRTRNMRSGRIGEEWTKFYQSVATLEPLPMYCSYDPYWTTARIRADLSRAVSQYGIEFAMIDHVGLLADTGLSATERETEISNSLSRIAKELNIHLFVISTMSKAGMTAGEANSANVKGSVQQIYNGNVIAQLMTDKREAELVSKTRAKIVFTKVREGDDEASRDIELMRKPGDVNWYCVTKPAQEYKR